MDINTIVLGWIELRYQMRLSMSFNVQTGKENVVAHGNDVIRKERKEAKDYDRIRSVPSENKPKDKGKKKKKAGHEQLQRETNHENEKNFGSLGRPSGPMLFLENRCCMYSRRASSKSTF